MAFAGYLGWQLCRIWYLNKCFYCGKGFAPDEVKAESSDGKRRAHLSCWLDSPEGGS